MMLSEWKKFVGWTVLNHFLEHPSEEFYIKQISRILDISPRSAQVYCSAYEKDEILLSEFKANAKMFKLNNELPPVKALKKFYFLERFHELGAIKKILSENAGLTSLALYGSYASGTYDEKSDIDFLVLSDRPIKRSEFVKLQKKLGKNIQLTEFTLAHWIGMKKSKDPFVARVLSNHVLLYGGML